MQNSVPRLPRPFPVPHTDPEGRLTPELASVVAGARRRALRDGDRQIDTAHLLHSLLEADPEARAALGSVSRVARVRGYLAQRSIGYGLRWRGAVEDSGAVPVVRLPLPRTAGGGAWSPSAVGAVDGALARAARRGAGRAAGVDLLAALVADPGCRAVEVLRRAGVDPEPLGDRAGGGVPDLL
ncbi:Clp protease N-terminal domain-containing protein [Streptomyces qinzhouensis]|uniref:Peptidase n=1 Tax=Streptomyces qinzhouensis TaxID=2599401 RepID=A0A5B8JDI3_9ACTN|nr:Clp protease N-terminal domain-containing protein [Streptomyces qinzhouensis]QDY75760.1 peptidase [Streptomyces qinzhouensis]